jgi:beta-barrel assembly-enhancing protease
MTDSSITESFAAEFFDGHSALSRQVMVRAELENLQISDLLTGNHVARWLISETHLISGKGPAALTNGKAPDARLILERPTLANILLDLNPDLKKPVKSVKSQKTHKMAWVLGFCAVVLIVGLLAMAPLLSGPLAKMASDDWRQRIGNQSSAQIEAFLGGSCSGNQGQVALSDMARRLAHHLPVAEKLDVRVIDNDMVNAFALSGGNIRFIRGLIDEANDPDEVAGVLAHEIAHVALRHPEELAFRNMGYDILLSTFADSGAVTEVAASAGIMLVNAAYSREAESAADALAFELLKEANISSTGMASFFARIEKMEGTSPRFLKYFNSHPATGKRREAATAHASEGYPALSVKSWQALKKICD